MTNISRPATAARPVIGTALNAWAPILFLVFVFLAGGASRSDVSSLPVLRGGAILFGCWAIAGMTRDDWRRVRIPLALLLALTGWMALQLVPLPPALWHGLPGRELIVAIDNGLGQADLWRPVSMTPSATWNSLLAMSVPLAAVLLATRLQEDGATKVMQALVALAVVSASLGIVQIVSGNGSAAYLYRITNASSMVGLFANRNHHSLFQACAIVLAAALLRDEFMRRQRRASLQLGYAAAAILSLAMTALIGSRAGMVAGGIAFAFGYAMLVPAWRARPPHHTRAGRASSPPQQKFGARQWFDYAPAVLVGCILVAVLLLTNRSTGLSRIAENRVAEDLRLLAWPGVQQIIESYWTVGAGFGAFPNIYQIVEADSLLQPAYFNHAHNDWVEVLITGGAPFALIVLAGLIWLFRSVWQLGFRRLIKGHRGDLRLPILLVVALFGGVSLVDYPLRVPSLQVMAVFLVILLASASGGAGSTGNKLAGES
ncbi:hypothetical protein FHR22_001048 [Sphingopyxis panaciterrae]|uniref:O-antigen ligase family protein n=1 Tax=Sphingopyxis panaciterrae TaxID=363841 RepID=UPI00142432B3|nr:O-antigen ligase family protein [Sphingopyxis panaciterrae]NIJ36399.1 hypothetical protein [Sphingopyxis panaciterrae]